MKKFDGKLSSQLPSPSLQQELVAAGEMIAEHFEHREYSRAVREIMALADRANQYIDEQKPWAKIKEDGKEQEVHDTCTQGINMFRVLVIYLKPILPELALKSEDFLNAGALSWDQLDQPLLDHAISTFKPLMTRIEKESLDKIIEASKQHMASQAVAAPTVATSIEPIAAEIEYDDFAKVDLRIARIIKAEHVAKADKLLQLTLDLGGETRTVFAGIKSAYDPKDLEGKLTVMVANLKPRKMKFGMSEGMVLAAGPGGKDLWVLNPDDGAQPGMKVK
jgi:methionyl-tRNA synthetase